VHRGVSGACLGGTVAGFQSSDRKDLRNLDKGNVIGMITVCGPIRGLPFLLVVDAVSGSLKPEGRVASSGLFNLLGLATVEDTVCPDGAGSSSSLYCEELDDDDTSSRTAFGVGPPNIGIHWSRGTDKRPEIDSGYKEMTLAGFMFKVTNESRARSNSPERNCDTASNALARLVHLSFDGTSISAGSHMQIGVHILYPVEGQHR